MRAIMRLIQAVEEHARKLRAAAQSDASEAGARTTEELADRWERLADDAGKEIVQP
jgi:hypothetical protein